MNPELPLITKIEHRRDGRAASEFSADLDAIIRGGNQKLADFARKAQDTLSSALSISRNKSGSLDLGQEIGQLKELSANQRATAAAATELAAAKARLAQSGTARTQADRAEIVELRRLAKAEGEANAATSARIATLEALQTELNQTKSATDRVVQATGHGTTAFGSVINSQRSARFAYIQANQQLQDMAIQWQSNTRLSTIFAQQVPQLGFALSGISRRATGVTGALGAFGRFMTGGWGTALAIGAVAISPLIDNLLAAATAAGEGVKAFDSAKFASNAMGEAQSILGTVLDLTTGKVQNQSQAMRDLAYSQLQVAKAKTLADSLDYQKQAQDAQKPHFRLRADPNFIDPSTGLVVPQLEYVRSPQANILARFNEGLNTPKQAIDQLVNLRKNGSLAADEFARLLGIVGSLGQATANIKIMDDAIKGLNGDAKALNQFLKPEAGGGIGSKTLGQFINPVGSARLTGQFGDQRAGRAAGYRHAGLDISVPVGSSVRAAATGTVITSGTLPGYGNVIIVDHGGGTTTRYAHLSSLLAAKGDVIGQGQVIGLSGGARGAAGSGNSTGPHLHYEIRVNGKAVDPTKGLFPVDEAKTAGAIERAIKEQADAAEKLQQMIDKANLSMIEGLVNSSQDVAANLQSLADEDFENLIDATERFRRASTQAFDDARAANDNLIGGLQDTVRLFDQIGESGKVLGTIGAALVGLKTGNFSGVGGASGLILRTLSGTVLKRGLDRDGNTTSRTLGEVFEKALDDVFGGQGKFIKVLDRAGIGLSAGSLIGKSNAGSAVGGILGGLGSDALAKSTGKFASSAVGKILGSALPIVGGLLGGLLGGVLSKSKTGSVSVSNGSQVVGGNNSQARSTVSGAADSVGQSLDRIASALGGSVGNYGYTIGQRNDEFRVSGDAGADVTGKNPKGNVIYKGKDAQEATRAALLNAIQDGAIKGIRQGASRLLQAGKDLETALSKALKFQNVFDELDARKDPIGSAVRKLNKEFEDLISIFKEAGATTEEYGSLEELYGLKRAETIKQQTDATKQANEALTSSLKDLISQLEISDSGLSLGDRYRNARSVFDPLADAVGSGQKVDYDKFTAAARDVIDIARQLYGSQAEYFSTYNQVLGLSKQALGTAAAGATSVDTNGLPASPFTATSAANDNSSILSALGGLGYTLGAGTSLADLQAQLAALNSNIGTLIQQGLANGSVVPTTNLAAVGYY